MLFIKPETIISRERIPTIIPNRIGFPQCRFVIPSFYPGREELDAWYGASATPGSKVGHTVENELRSPVAFSSTERWGGGGVIDSCGPSREIT